MSLARITFTLPIEGNDTHSRKIVEALEALADIMLVQAEDGLWTLGSPDASDLTDEHGNVTVENEYLRGIGSGQSYSIEVDGVRVSTA